MTSATNAKPTRNDERKARTNAAILKAAQSVIRRNGFEAASIDEISARADVGVGSSYHHFGSKEGLLLALVERAITANQEYLTAGFESAGTPLQRLAAVQASYLRFFAERPFDFDLVILECERRTSYYSSAAVTRIGQIAEATLLRIVLLVEEAQVAREIRELDPGDAARFLWGALNGLLASSRRADALALTSERTQEVLGTGMSIVLEGLATRRGLNRLTA